MSATFVQDSAVTPAKVRRRGRDQQRGPVARPQQLAAPVGRPVQPGLAGLSGAPVGLQARPAEISSPARPAGVQLTDRGIALIACLLALIVAASVAVGVGRFLAISEEPLPAPASQNGVGSGL
ncbi:hypothetical protein [Luteococcus sp. OSA5]|uniref:hypothetical protein n=1 Tax=Luteococcus sp. OSA5 TaxID=3401630 RepID=UPI003B429FCE